ncbi:N-acetylmuramoyl-L-alanine amidase [uncultured Clostridium sp.]|uniref:N-acetylmuramoyl-L-alanine amidase n=1 Tax=uncultured Clostridium sp. TaxID=59620 RepID=UPI002630F7C4|nr:N-acetylmuramoyl-L-alanine amidase [uncultured Clostridium sp.]
MKAQDLLLIIDMGHGGSDPGASGNGVIEKIANFNTGMALKKYFEGKGITVILTRVGDATKSLSQRTTFANAEAKKCGKKKAIYISVHHNAGGGDRGEYIYSIYGGAGKEIAEAIGTEMNKQLGQQKKCYTKKGTDNKDYYYVIKNTSMPAVIVEVAFLDNKTDVQICDTVAEQERNGRVIGDGILKWAGIAAESKPPTNSGNISSSIKVGDRVNITGTKYATGQSVSNWAKTQVHTISKINGDKALLKEINSWCYLKDLKINNSKKTLKVGDYVKMNGVKWATGQNVSSWVKDNKYKIKEINGDKALLDSVISWAYIKDLIY